MKLTIILTPEAQADIREAVHWYENQEAGLGSRFKQETRKTLRVISEQAFAFPLVNSVVRRALLRRYPYSVYFRVETEAVIVIAVLHQHRSPKSNQ